MGQTDPGRIWQHRSNFNEAWIPTSISLAKHGSEVFTQLMGFSQTARLVSCYAPDPAPAEFAIPGPHLVEHVHVDSADDADVHVSLFAMRQSVASQTQARVCKYSSSTSQADWEWTFPFPATSRGGVHVTSDGETVIAWSFNAFQNTTEIAFFRDGSDEPTQTVSWFSWGSPTVSTLSDDDRYFAINGGEETAVYDVQSGQREWTSPDGPDLGYGVAISSDGSRVARSVAIDKVDVFERSGDGYSLLHSVTVPGAGCRALDFDSNGTTLFSAFNHVTPDTRTTLKVIDLVNGDEWTHVISGTGSYHISALDLEASDDGDCFAIGLTGDQPGLIPELQVFTRTPNGYALSFSENLPGTVFDVELSRDGKRLAAASKSVHEIVLGNGGQIDLFDLESRDFAVRGAPNLGTSFTIEQHVGTGRHALTLRSPRRARDPVAIGNLGTLFLERGSTSSIASGTAGASGKLESVVDIPNIAALAGTQHYYQCLMTGPRKLSEDWACVTVLP